MPAEHDPLLIAVHVKSLNVKMYFYKIILYEVENRKVAVTYYNIQEIS